MSQQDEAEQGSSRRQTLVVGLVFVAVAVAYLVSIPGMWSIHPDSALYMTAGRSLARGDGYTVNTTTFGKYPPVYPALLAIVYATVGESFWWLQFIGAASGIGACVAAYLWARRRTETHVALAVAVLTVTTTWFWNNACAQILSGIPYVFLAFLTLWLSERAIRDGRWSVPTWAGVTLLTWAALYTHMSGVALVPGIVAAVLFAKGASGTARQRLTAAGMVGVVCTAAAAFWLFGGWEAGQGRSYKGLTQNEPRRVLKAPYEKLQMRAREWVAAPLSQDYENIHEIAAFALLGLLFLPGFVRGLRRERSVAEFYLLAYFLVQYLHGGRDGHQRYVLPVLPLMFYYGQDSLRVLGRAGAFLIGEKRRRLILGRGAMVLAFAALFGNAVYSVIRSRNGATDINARERLEEKAERLAVTVDCIEEYVPKDATVYAADGGAAWIVFHYTTERRMGKCLQSYTHEDLLRGMVEWDADFVLKTKGQLQPRDVQDLLDAHPDIFSLVEATKRTKLYRIDKAALRRHVQTLD